MSISISRRIDELGRICIPKNMRDVLDIDSYDRIDIKLDGDKILLSKTDTSELESNIRKVKNLASDSRNHNLTTNEYDNLCQLLDKLASKKS